MKPAILILALSTLGMSAAHALALVTFWHAYPRTGPIAHIDKH